MPQGVKHWVNKREVQRSVMKLPGQQAEQALYIGWLQAHTQKVVPAGELHGKGLCVHTLDKTTGCRGDLLAQQIGNSRGSLSSDVQVIPLP